MPKSPEPQHVRDLCAQFFASPTLGITRFPTGLCHCVFDVALANGDGVVVRIANDDNRSCLKGGIFWSNLLRPIGIPLPALIAADATVEPFGYMILERLAGTDLCNVYETLNTFQKRELARALAAIQGLMATLPRAAGFGGVLCLDGLFPYATWGAAMEGHIARSRQWTKAAGVIGFDHIRRVEQRLLRHEDYFATVAPTAFLDDITTKNVLVNEGTLSGIVDVDEVCFGDPLFCLALTRMALLARRLETDYIDYWVDALALNRDQLDVLDCYTAMHCACFIGEIGQRFNKAASEPVNAGYAHHLLGILDRLLSGGVHVDGKFT